jgi:hypothetical protein
MNRKLVSALLIVWAAAACGRDGSINVQLAGPGSGPQSPTINGGVLAPNSTLAAGPSMLQRLAAHVLPEAQALDDSVQPIGAGVNVVLSRVLETEVPGEFTQDRLASSPTNIGGRFAVPFGADVVPGECGLLLHVGADETLTRALVFDQEDQDVRAETEAVVRLIVSALVADPTLGLCNFAPDEIVTLRDAVMNAAEFTGGDTVSELNANVEAAARQDAEVIRLLAEFSAP